MNLLKIALLISGLTIFIAACGDTATKPNTNKPANQPANNTTSAQPSATKDEMASAAVIYKEKCSRCHKEDGTGGKVDIEGTTINAEDLTSDKMKNMDDAKYIKILNEGIKDEGMPAFKGKLTDDEMKSVVAYIRKEFQK